MPVSKAQLKTFFEEYEARVNRAISDPPEVDAKATAAAFADFFLEASPLGIECAENGEKFLQVIPEGFKHYRKIGTKEMRMESINFVEIDELHSVVTVGWRAVYAKKDADDVAIEFKVHYMVQALDENPKIFAYVTGDEQKALRDAGII